MGLLRSLAGTGMKRRIPVLGVRIGTTRLRTRTTTLVVAAFVTQDLTLMFTDIGSAKTSGQPFIPASANTFMGSAIRGSQVNNLKPLGSING